jgi:hypothetical protein
MKCEEAAEWFGSYRDLPEHSAESLRVDLHISECKLCMEEFLMWEQSAQLIHDLPSSDYEQDEPISTDWVNQNVMNRIYSEQSWYLPAVRRTYSFSFTFRKKIAGLLAALFTIFICGFLYTSNDRWNGGGSEGSGVMETASAFSVRQQFGNSVHLDVPVASLSDPIMLNVSPAMPEYWIALSMLGMIMTLLILNWFSRVRS